MPGRLLMLVGGMILPLVLRLGAHLNYSITYHCWTLLGVHSTWLYTADTEIVETLWTSYTKAVDYLGSLVGDTGLVNSSSAFLDWGRDGGGGYSISPNALYYKVSAFVGVHMP